MAALNIITNQPKNQDENYLVIIYNNEENESDNTYLENIKSTGKDMYEWIKGVPTSIKHNITTAGCLVYYNYYLCRTKRYKKE